MSNRVCAIVVTYNRKELLRNCLQALQNQTRPIDAILVVDNASTDGTAEMWGEFPDVKTLRLPENIGGAGGFHEGMKLAYSEGYDWLWAMDDDGVPALDCLEKLLEKAKPNSVIIPVQQGDHGPHGVLAWQGGNYVDLDVHSKVPIHAARAGETKPAKDVLFTFVGPLIPRSVVDKVGLPNREFFIWFDDFEYAFRIKRFTKSKFIVVPEAKFFHEPGINWREVRLLGLGKPKQRRTFAVWRSYYMARNSFYTLLRTRKRPNETLLFLVHQIRVLAAVLLYDPDRWPRAQMQLRGLRDGAIGRMGRNH